MFFGLINLPATFQTMINKILRNLVDTRKVASFIDDVIVGLEEEKGHNEVVEKVIKRLEKNDVYIKPEKIKWKMREVRYQDYKKWT